MTALISGPIVVCPSRGHLEQARKNDSFNVTISDAVSREIVEITVTLLEIPIIEKDEGILVQGRFRIPGEPSERSTRFTCYPDRKDHGNFRVSLRTSGWGSK